MSPCVPLFSAADALFLGDVPSAAFIIDMDTCSLLLRNECIVNWVRQTEGHLAARIVAALLQFAAPYEQCSSPVGYVVNFEHIRVSISICSFVFVHILYEIDRHELRARVCRVSCVCVCV